MPRDLDELRGASLVMRQIEESAPRAGMAGQHGSKDVTRGSADVSDVRVGGEVIGGSDSRCVAAVDAHQHVAEHGGFFGMGSEIVEEREAEVVIERGLARLDGVEQFGPGEDKEIPGNRKDGRTDRARDVGAERLGERRE